MNAFIKSSYDKVIRSITQNKIITCNLVFVKVQGRNASEISYISMLSITELSLKLATAAGIREEELPNIRREALLHDIGKLGVPDSILLKPGKLTEEK